MPWVSFTDHAIKRCRQQGIRIQDVKSAILSMPPTAGRFKWHFPKRFSVVVHYYPEIERFTVITVIGVNRMDWKPRAWKG